MENLNKVEKVYGPYTIECGPFGRFTRLFLWFCPMHVYETPDSVITYKVLGKAMYILLTIHKPHKQGCEGGTHEREPRHN